ncbi:MAG: CAP domain-containing protein [Ramlibacter sp.]
MSRKTNAAAGVHLAVVLAVATLAGCASAPAPSASGEPATSTTLSGPPDVPTIGCNAAALRQSVLQRVNQARTSGQMCGDGKQAALKPLVWQPALATAATRRATEMAQRGTFGTVDRAMEQRLRAAGYRPVAAQENAAAGDFSPEMVAQTWLTNQQQCAVLMNPQYTDIGAGCASAPGTEWGHYFTVVVARPGEGGMAKPLPAKPSAKPKSKSRASSAAAKPKARSTASASRPVATKKVAPVDPRQCTTAACKATPAVR